VLEELDPPDEAEEFEELDEPEELEELDEEPSDLVEEPLSALAPDDAGADELEELLRLSVR